MFNFIETAMAEHNIRKCERELEKDNATVEDLQDLDMAMELSKTLGVRKACNIAFGCKGDGDDNEIGTMQMLKAIILQQTNITTDEKVAQTIAKMIAKVDANDIPSDPGSIRRFLLKSGFSESDVDLYYTGCVAISNTPYYANMVAGQDQSIVDRIQDANSSVNKTNNTTQPVTPNSTNQYAQWGFQPAPELIQPNPIPPITPVAPSSTK